VTIDLANNPQGGEAVPGQELADTLAETPELENENPETDNLEPETEEIEWKGQKHSIPRALKDAFLVQADYTKKTQDIATEREALANERKSFSEQANSRSQAELAEVGELYALKKTVDDWAKVNWQDLRNKAQTVQDLAQIQGLESEYHKAQNELAQKSGAYQQKLQQRALDANRDRDTQVEQAHAAVAKDIKEWSPEHFNKLTDFAVRAGGFRADDLKAVSDPRALKLLHLAYIGDQSIKKLAAQAKAAAAESAQPLPQVGSKAGANQRRASDPSGDKLSDTEWTNRRREELRKRK
jgi:hypothetical protein